MASDRPLSLLLRPGRLLFLAGLLGVLLSASLFVWWAEAGREEAAQRADFERSVDLAFGSLVGRLETFRTVLRAASGYVAEHPWPRDNEWQGFAGRALGDAEAADVRLLSIAMAVSADGRDGFVAEVRSRLWRDFAIRPANPSGPAAVIVHVAPSAGTGSLLGLDIAADPARRRAAEQARDSGQLAFLPFPVLARAGEEGGRGDLTLVQPVFHRGYPTGNPDQRCRALLGWLLLEIRAPSLLANSVDRLGPSSLEVQVYADRVAAENRIFGTAARHGGAGGFHAERALEFAGTRWIVVADRALPRSALWFGAAPLTLLGLALALSLAATLAAALLIVSREQSRRLATQALGRLGLAERTLAGITAAAPGMVFQWRIAGEREGFSFVSPQSQALFGVAPQDLMADWHRLPFEADLLARWPGLMAEAAAQGERWQMEGRYGAVNGRELWWKVTAAPVVAADGVVLINGIFIDISEQKEAQRQLAEREQTYREMFERIGVVKVLIDPVNGIVADANEAARFFYSRGTEELRGKSVHEVSLLDPDACSGLLKRCARGEQLFYRSRHRLASGEIREVEVSLGPVRVRGRQYVHAVITDVTDRERYQAELKEKSVKLEMSNAELEQFSYVVSHDLREPLRTIASFLQLLERRYGERLDGDGREFIAFAVDAAKRLQGMIQDLLDYSRIGTRGQPFAPTDMNAVLALALGNLTRAVEESGAVLESAPLPIVVADRTQMVSLLQNLLANALKYRRPQVPPRIGVTVEEEAERWVFAVADNGIGIDRQYFDRIFLVFQRLHTQEQFSGSGIGLALCRKIVRRHGGEIWLDSAPGTGTTFYFSLPKGPAPTTD